MAEFQLKRSHSNPFHAQNNRLCAAGSNSGAPRSQEISPLTCRTALERRSVSSGSHPSVFCFEQSHGDLFHDQNVPHIELKLLRLASFLLSLFFFVILYYVFFCCINYYFGCLFVFLFSFRLLSSFFFLLSAFSLFLLPFPFFFLSHVFYFFFWFF